MKLREIINQEAEVNDLDILLEKEFDVDEKDLPFILKILECACEDDNEKTYVKSYKIFAAYCSHQMRKEGVSEQTIGRYLEYADAIPRSHNSFEKCKEYAEKVVQKTDDKKVFKVVAEARKKFLDEIRNKYIDLIGKDRALQILPGWSHVMGSTVVSQYNLLKYAVNKYDLER